MLNAILTKLNLTKHQRDIKRLKPKIAPINELEPEIKALDDEALKAKTGEFRARLDDGADLDDLLVPAFATVREAARRTVGMRHYDVQLIGGMVLHLGKITEMKTGEGKTLVAPLAVYLNALTGRGVHLVTVNDYLARRDADWMGPIYQALGMKVGVIQTNMPDRERQTAYAADITYGTNNEFGFDLLRDNMKYRIEDMVQRDHYYAIVDEVDSILIDEARTPLIISGPSEESIEKYELINGLVRFLERGEEHEEDGEKWTTGDFIVDEKAQAVSLTEEGVSKAEKLFKVDNLYEMVNIELLHGLHQALRAHQIYKKDVDYLIKGDEVVIVDEFTGRMMEGRRWSDGLHQAVEAKEKVKIKQESQTFATITFQNYFRIYEKLAGMTGTAETEEAEFGEIYDLDVTVIPPNRPMIREDYPDSIFVTQKEKWKAVLDEILDCHRRGQPVLVGTISIENSEKLSKMLKVRGLKSHVVLNAKFHDREAEIVAQAGRKGAVTIATNMAGRGTDIVLGGNPEATASREADPETDPSGYAAALDKYRAQCAAEREEVLAAGGLHILGTERHESRRIDNQLRGRSGRQGDPGSSRFYLSLEDDLMRLFGTDRFKGLMSRVGMEEDEALEHKWVTKAIERAQRAVESRHFDHRKHLLKYDDVMNKQRSEFYALRRGFLQGDESREYVMNLSHDFIDFVVTNRSKEDPESSLQEALMILKEGGEDKWMLGRFAAKVRGDLGIDVSKLDEYEESVDDIDVGGLRSELQQLVEKEDPDKRMLKNIAADVHNAFNLDAYKLDSFNSAIQGESFEIDAIQEELWKAIEEKYSAKEKEHGEDAMRRLERDIMLKVVDRSWKDHLLAIDHMKEGIHLRAQAQKDPLIEYKRESFDLFQEMKDVLEDNIVSTLFRTEPVSEEQFRERLKQEVERKRRILRFSAPEKTARPQTVKRTGRKVGRNEMCPCGSGKKFKLCHGAHNRRLEPA